MPSLAPYVPNTPLTVAKNLRFAQAGILVTELLPVGMVGTTVYDTPTTGYISRIGSILSDQIDAYSIVNSTLSQYLGYIQTLQGQVLNLETSGTTIPVVNGHCYNGNTPILITTLLDLVTQDLCNYKSVLGSTTNLALAIASESPSTLNTLPAFSQSSAMAGLAGWLSTPTTIADTVNNLWLAYKDSRTALQETQEILKPSCSQVIIDFLPVLDQVHYTITTYLDGYSFIPTAYTDNGSTLVVTDGVGGTYSKAINVVTQSQSGAIPVTINISGTPLVDLSNYTVTLNSKLISSSNSCTKVVIHSTNKNSGCTTCSPTYQVGEISGTVIDSSRGLTVSTALLSNLIYANVIPLDATTAGIFPYYITLSGTTFTIKTTSATVTPAHIKWVAYSS